MAEANPMLSLDALTFQNAQAALDQGCAALAAGETVFESTSGYLSKNQVSNNNYQFKKNKE